MKLLLVEDDAAMRTTLQRTLERRGVEVTACSDGPQGLARWQAGRHDVVVLDLSLPGLDGLHVLERGRSAGPRTPVIVLTARGTVGDRVLGLNTGADDYLPKPFDLDELEARVRALARRHGSAATLLDDEVAPAFHGLSVDAASQAVCHRGRPMELTPREAALARALLARAGQALSKERLCELVFPDERDVQT